MTRLGPTAHPPAPPMRDFSSRGIAFRRLHGLGNDYVFLHERSLDLRRSDEVARVLSDRHRGVGGDGVISIEAIGDSDPGSTPRLRMRMWNADGSEGGMCGNGVRGAVRFAIEEGLVEVGETGAGRAVVVEIGAREVRCRVVETSPRFLVSVDMGECVFEWSAIPFRPVRPLAAATSGTLRSPDELDTVGASQDIANSFALRGFIRGWSVASMGNPHLVLAVPDAERIDEATLAALGSSLEHAVAFPERTNVHLVEVRRRDRFRMRTWERGTGRTLACGSGACAAFAILRRAGELDAAATAMLDGGELELAMLESDRIEMTGPTEHCCAGTVDLGALLAAGRRRPTTIESPLEIDLVEGGAT